MTATLSYVLYRKTYRAITRFTAMSSLCGLLFLCAGWVGAQEEPPALTELDANKPYAAADYAFLSHAIGSRRVVALGESIHVTREMPVVRLKMVRYLHEQLGFNLLALEGSLMDTWTAQEHAYKTGEPLTERAARMKREALFGLWQTAPMQDVMAYALETQATTRPLYLTSFDLQPGMARAYSGSVEQSLRAFFRAVAPYDPTLDPVRVERWTEKLSAALACTGDFDPGPLVDEIEAWLNGPVEATLVRSRPPMHVATLRLVPLMLRNRLLLCRKWTADKRSMITYQLVRDELNAQLVIEQLKTLPGPPSIILWAHHSHLHYNSLGHTIPSMGQHLHDALHAGIYTIGFFANGGSAIDTAMIDQAHGLGFLVALAPKAIPNGPRWSVEEKLAAQSPRDFYLDLHHASKEWVAPGMSRLENNGRMPTALSADFDGAVLLHHVSAADLDFLPGWLRLASRIVGVVMLHSIATALVVVALILVLVRLVLLRRRAKTVASEMR